MSGAAGAAAPGADRTMGFFTRSAEGVPHPYRLRFGKCGGAPEKMFACVSERMLEHTPPYGNPCRWCRREELGAPPGRSGAGRGLVRFPEPTTADGMGRFRVCAKPAQKRDLFFVYPYSFCR